MMIKWNNKRSYQRWLLIKARTPEWADAEKIRAIYRESKRKGTRYHVDHIVPLSHPGVCGLHIHNNLKVDTAKANLQKGNRFWPDMWMEQYSLDIPEYLHEHQLRLF